MICRGLVAGLRGDVLASCGEPRHPAAPMQVDFFLMAANRRAHRLRPERSYVLGREEGVALATA